MIKALLRKNDYDVIHYHNMSLMGITALSYGRAVKLYTMHEHWLVCPMHVLWKFNREPCTKRYCLLCTLYGKRPPQLWRYTGLLKKMLQHVDGFISPSRFTKKKHHKLGLNIPIKHIPYFLPRTDKQANEEPSENLSHDRRPFFLFVGRLEKIKGLQNLIPVFKKHAKYDLLIAGDGTYEKVLKGIAEDAANIKFLGRLSFEKLHALYRKALAVIVPSICYEVFGIIIIEAFSMKTPVIVNDLGAMPEVVQGSGGGFVYRNENELINVMEKLSNDPGLRRTLGDNGYQAYLRYWSEDAHIEKYVNFIQEIREKKHNEKRGIS
jgi:glycosyltransferase involved in cell wall biosynthesis